MQAARRELQRLKKAAHSRKFQDRLKMFEQQQQQQQQQAVSIGRSTTATAVRRFTNDLATNTQVLGFGLYYCRFNFMMFARPQTQQHPVGNKGALTRAQRQRMTWQTNNLVQ